TSIGIEHSRDHVGAADRALGVLEPSGKSVSLSAYKAAPHATTLRVRELIASHGKSIDISAFPAIVELFAEPKTVRLLDSDLPEPMRQGFNSILGGRAALVAPVTIREHTFGLLGFVWSEPRDAFDEHEVAL